MKRYYDRNGIRIYNGSCLKLLPKFKGSIASMIFADLPYGTTYASWDSVIPMPPLWRELNRLIVGNGAMLFTAVQPFSSALVSSNWKQFRYGWIWDKANASNFANAKKQPLKQHEEVLVFSKGQTPYYPIRVPGKKNHVQGKSTRNVAETRLISGRVEDDLSGLKYPKSILNFPKHSSQCGLHPTQKPIDLLSYLLRTYTLETELVLDPTMGSGTTLEAAARLNRRAIGIEISEKYCETAAQRLDKFFG